MRSGVTLLELVVVLAISGAAISILAPAARRAVDRFAVVSAREALAGRVATTRMRALASGGASLVVDGATGSAWIEIGLAVSDSGPLGTPVPVDVTLLGVRTRAALRYDALGIGRVASQSVRFTRHGAVATLVISAFGGVTRR